MNEKPDVLLIDDETSVTDFLTTCLQAQGLNALVAHDGAAGLRLARERRPALILLDRMMPGLSGIETLAALKGEEATRHIPVVMLTAMQESEDFSEAFEKGADGYIAKPYPVAEILLILKRFNVVQ